MKTKINMLNQDAEKNVYSSCHLVDITKNQGLFVIFFVFPVSFSIKCKVKWPEQILKKK